MPPPKKLFKTDIDLGGNNVENAANIIDMLARIVVLESNTGGGGILYDTETNWQADNTVYEEVFLVSTDVFYGTTSFPKLKLADGVNTWDDLDYLPLDTALTLTLAQVLANNASTNETTIHSNNNNSQLKVNDAESSLNHSGVSGGGGITNNPTETKIEHTNHIHLDAPTAFLDQGYLKSENAKAILSLLASSSGVSFEGTTSYTGALGDAIKALLYFYDGGTGTLSQVELKEAKATVSHPDNIELTSSSVTKNGSEIATESFVHSIVTSNIKIIGDWDATSGSYPLADESNTTPFIAQWGSTIKAGWAFNVGYGQAGTVDGYDYEEGDVVYALVDNPTDDSTDWGDLDHNLQQASESLRGTAKITTDLIIEDETTLDNEKIITPYKFWAKAIPKFKLLANTWNLLQTFTSGIKTDLLTNDTGEFKLGKTVPGTILLWTNGQHLRWSATTGGAPSVELDKTTGKMKMLDETASKLVELDSNKGISSIPVSKDSIIKDSFDITFDGQGGVLSVGANAIKRALAVAGDVTGFSLKADASGSVEIDMKKNGVSMIGGGNKIDLITQSSDTGLPTSWTSTTFAIDDEMEWSITSATTIKKVWLTVKYNKTS